MEDGAMLSVSVLSVFHTLNLTNVPSRIQCAVTCLLVLLTNRMFLLMDA